MSRNKDLTLLNARSLFNEHQSQAALLTGVFTESKRRVEKMTTDISDQRNSIDTLRVAGYSTQHHSYMLDKAVEEMALFKRRVDLNEVQLTGRLQMIVTDLYGLFKDVEGDYLEGYINQQEYIGYLQLYKLMLENTNGLSLYQIHPIEKIRAEIRLHLT